MVDFVLLFRATPASAEEVSAPGVEGAIALLQRSALPGEAYVAAVTDDAAAAAPLLAADPRLRVIVRGERAEDAPVCDRVVYAGSAPESVQQWIDALVAQGRTDLRLLEAEESLAASSKAYERITAEFRRQNGRLAEKERDLSAKTTQLEIVLDEMLHGLILLDHDLCVRLFNRRVADIIGFGPDIVAIGVSATRIAEAGAALIGGDARQARQHTRRWLDRLTRRRTSRHQQDLADGRVLEVTYVPLADGGWLLSYDDVTARVRAERGLAAQNSRFDAALANMQHGLAMFDAERRLILCNDVYRLMYSLPAALAQAGTSLREILAYRVAIGNAPADMGAYLDIPRIAEENGRDEVLRAELKDGRTVRIHHNLIAGGGYVATHEDITEAVRAEERIRHLATHDVLTGLPNRSLLRAKIDEALVRVPRGARLAVICLDLDHFKAVNDTLGHPAGDALLKAVTERLLASVRESDVVARLGGDEFVVLQVGIETPEDAGVLARRIVEVVSEPFDIEGNEIVVGASIGVAFAPHDGQDADVLLKNADMALYRAKADGRSVVRFFEPAMDAKVQARRQLELDLRKALAAQEFELHYQPVVSAGTQRIVAFEALVRWNHPERGLVPPGQFIPLAEEFGLIGSLGEWVLRTACSEATRWPPSIGVAVNLSPAQFRSRTLAHSIVALLAETGLSAHRLELEITESVLLANTEPTYATLHHLRGLGVKIAMDDFGTGYSSLSYLRAFPFDRIKIDRSFVQELEEMQDCRAIIRAVASLGESLGMATTAEGVETAEQLRLVRDLGCSDMQGYYFSRPRPAAGVKAMLADLRPSAKPARKRA